MSGPEPITGGPPAQPARPQPRARAIRLLRAAIIDGMRISPAPGHGAQADQGTAHRSARMALMTAVQAPSGTADERARVLTVRAARRR